MNSPQIAGIVERGPLLSLKKSIGEKAYLFAVKKAPFLTGPVEIPAADDRGDERLKHQIIKSGLKCFAACFDQEPEALTRRLAFKLPKGKCPGFGPWESGLEKKKAGNILRKVLLKEVGPQWAPYFT